MKTAKCDVCKKEVVNSELIAGHGIRHEIENLILKDFPDWDDYKRICKDDFNIYRQKYVSSMIEDEDGSVKALEKEVLASINANELIVANVNALAKEKMKFGDAVADKVASFGGSWKFIIIFFFILGSWISVNSYFIFKVPFDPYPYILMNLILSCIAAIQAPIIMMSQNRQGEKDRIHSENDYKVNLKSEIEIRMLHEKVDHLLLDQWAKIMKIQEIQIDILEEIKKKTK